MRGKLYAKPGVNDRGQEPSLNRFLASGYVQTKRLDYGGEGDRTPDLVNAMRCAVATDSPLIPRALYGPTLALTAAIWEEEFTIAQPTSQAPTTT